MVIVYFISLFVKFLTINAYIKHIVNFNVFTMCFYQLFLFNYLYFYSNVFVEIKVTRRLEQKGMGQIGNKRVGANWKQKGRGKKFPNCG